MNKLGYLQSLFGLTAILGFPLQAQVYFVCDQHPVARFNGNNKNSGTRAESAWRTIDFALKQYNNEKVVGAGDTIAFCRGGQFVRRQNSLLSNTASTADLPIRITSYAPNRRHASCQQIPLIKAPKAEELNSKIKRLPALLRFGDRRNQVVHNEGLIIEQLILTAEDPFKNQKYSKQRYQQVTRAGISIYDDFDYVTLKHLEISNMDNAIAISNTHNYPISENPAVGRLGGDGTADHYQILDSYIHDNLSQGIHTSANDLTIAGNQLINNGRNPKPGSHVLYHNIYISKQNAYKQRYQLREEAAKNILIKNNVLHQSAMSDRDNNPSTVDICDGVSLVAHGVTDNMTIAENLIWEEPNSASPSCWGIAANNGYGFKHPEAMFNLKIHDNVLLNNGNTAISCGNCNGAIIKNNRVFVELSSSRNGLDPFGFRGIMVEDRANQFDPCYIVNTQIKPFDSDENRFRLQRVEYRYEFGEPVSDKTTNKVLTDPNGYFLRHSMQLDDPGWPLYSTADQNIGFSRQLSLYRPRNNPLQLRWQRFDAKSYSQSGLKSVDPYTLGQSFLSSDYTLSTPDLRLPGLNCTPKHVVPPINRSLQVRISGNQSVIQVDQKRQAGSFRFGERAKDNRQARFEFFDNKTEVIRPNPQKRCSAVLHKNSDDILLDEQGKPSKAWSANQCQEYETGSQPAAMARQKMQQALELARARTVKDSEDYWRRSGLIEISDDPSSAHCLASEAGAEQYFEVLVAPGS